MLQFHQFQVTRHLRGSGDVVTRTVILPAQSDKPSEGFWLAKQRVANCYPGAEIRPLGLTSRQVWEVATP